MKRGRETECEVEGVYIRERKRRRKSPNPRIIKKQQQVTKVTHLYITEKQDLEKGSLLRLSVSKLARISTPGTKLCQAVLINNTLRNLQNDGSGRVRESPEDFRHDLCSLAKLEQSSLAKEDEKSDSRDAESNHCDMETDDPPAESDETSANATIQPLLFNPPLLHILRTLTNLGNLTKNIASENLDMNEENENDKPTNMISADVGDNNNAPTIYDDVINDFLGVLDCPKLPCDKSETREMLNRDKENLMGSHLDGSGSRYSYNSFLSDVYRVTLRKIKTRVQI